MSRRRHVAFRTALVAAWLSVLPASANETASKPATEITIFAAASLTNAFTEIARAFEQQRPGTRVTLNFGGSQQLAAQILEGAPADVFASANGEQMQRIADASLVHGTAAAFAVNRLAVAVERGNPKHITGLADLGRTDLKIVLAAEEVPAGRYAHEILSTAGVSVTPVSLETDVRAVLTKVALGEADAGIVYESDFTSAHDGVTKVEIPSAQNAVATYPIAVLARGMRNEAAASFVAFVLSQTGQAALVRFGFGPP